MMTLTPNTPPRRPRSPRLWLWGALAFGALLVLSGCPTDEGDSAEDLDPCANLLQLQERIGGQIASDVPGAFALADYDISTSSGRVTARLSNPCGDAVAARLTDSACGFCNTSGARCEDLVRGVFSPQGLPLECSPCGDGICASGETEQSCPNDCQFNCGDGLCEDGEEPLCPLDCVVPCGNGVCESNETNITCPVDCNYTAGDGLCGLGENPLNSPNDCRGETCNGEGVCAESTCGDGFCQSYETTLNCPGDCCDAVCDGGIGAACRGRDVVECNLIGAGNCPELIALETCAVGCRDGACISCPDIGGIDYCDGPQPPTCTSNERRRYCLPLPGYPDCYQKVIVECGEGPDGSPLTCTEEQGCGGTCPEDTCLPNSTRCLDSARIQRCEIVDGEPCPLWLTIEICREGDRCDGFEGRTECGDPDATLADERPFIEALSPTAAAPGDEVLFTGRNFGEAPGEVLFRFNQPGQILDWSDDQVRVVVPENAQSGEVVLTTTATVSATALFQLDASLQRITTCGAPGQSITLFGANLNALNVRAVTFTPNQRAVIDAYGSDDLQVFVPPGAQDGPITLTTYAGRTIPSNADFRVLDPSAFNPPRSAVWPIPDSNLFGCSNGLASIPCPDDPAATGFGQDGGRLDNAPNVAVVSDNVNHDQVTGLMWRRFPEGPTFTTWSDAFCRCDDAETDGFTDWRLPSAAEMLSVYDYSFADNFFYVDPAIWPGLVSGGVWTFEPGEATGERLQAQPFGVSSTRASTRNVGVACVRAPEPLPGPEAPRFVDLTDDTATDQLTGLMWTRRSIHTPPVTWVGALELCEALDVGGHTDWRTPTLRELHSVTFDFDRDPITGHDDTVFPDLWPYLWSSTQNPNQPTRASGVFVGRELQSLDASQARGALCVRDAE